MNIVLSKSRQCKAVRPRNAFMQILQKALVLTGFSNDSGIMEVVFLDKNKMIKLNGLHLHHQGVTDVITYDLRDKQENWIPAEEQTQGSIYICPEVAREAAEKYNSSFSREIVLYAVHGLLHLAGEDDLDDAARKSMRAAEKRVMEELDTQFDLEQFYQQI